MRKKGRITHCVFCHFQSQHQSRSSADERKRNRVEIVIVRDNRGDADTLSQQYGYIIKYDLERADFL